MCAQQSLYLYESATFYNDAHNCAIAVLRLRMINLLLIIIIFKEIIAIVIMDAQNGAIVSSSSWLTSAARQIGHFHGFS